MRSRQLWGVSVLVILVLLSGCSTLSDTGSDEVRIYVEHETKFPGDPGSGSESEATIIGNNGTYRIEQTGETVSQECVRELEALLLGNASEPTCSDDEHTLQRIDEITEERDNKRERLRSLKQELEQARAHNQTGKVEELEGEIRNLSRELEKLNSQLDSHTACETHAGEERFSVRFERPNSENTLVESPWIYSDHWCYSNSIEVQIGQSEVTTRMSAREMERLTHIVDKIASTSEDE